MNTPNELIECACGCKGVFEKYDKRGRERKYLPSHWSKFQPNKRRVVTCEHCGKIFERPQWHINRIKHFFCSHKCEGKWSSIHGRRRGKNNGHYNTIEVPCFGCGNLVTKAVSLIMRRNNRVYCKDCIPIKAHPGRKGFYVGYPKEFTPSLRHQIRKRDNFTCQICWRKQSDTGTLHVHHIDYNKTNNLKDNLISLCQKCHGTTNFSMDEWSYYLKSFMIARQEQEPRPK